MAKGTKSLHHGVKVDDNGNVYLKGTNAEPDDATVDEKEIVYWIDTSGTPTLKVKARIGGTVYSGDVATLS